MYIKLKNLLLEGLSAPAKHYLLLNRRKKNPINKHRTKEIGIQQFKIKKLIPQKRKR